MRFTLEHSFRAPIDPVFRFFADPRERPRWQRSLRSVSVETQGAPGLGTRWSESPKGLGRVEMEISEFRPPTRWAERGRSKFGALDLALSFSAEGETTRMVLEANVELSWPLGWCAAVAKPLMLREIRSDLERAAAILERELPAAR